jgi:hypothetical protein
MANVHDLSFDEIAHAVKCSIPSPYSDAIVGAARANEGSEHAKALTPLCKFLTIGLDQATQSELEAALIKNFACAGDIKFIKTCPSIDHERFQNVMWALTPFMSSVFPEYHKVATSNYNRLWYVFNDKCKRDGSLFLRKVRSGFETDSLDEIAETFVASSA